MQLLTHIASKGKPIILSTGMSTIGEIEVAIQTIEDAPKSQIYDMDSIGNFLYTTSYRSFKVWDVNTMKMVNLTLIMVSIILDYVVFHELLKIRFSNMITGLILTKLRDM